MPSVAAAMRAEIPCLVAEAYLNSGGAGPLARPVADAVTAAVGGQLARGRMGVAALAAGRDGRQGLRRSIEGLLGARPGEVGLAQSTTHAMCAVIWGIDWAPGDEVVTTDLEHPGLTVPLRVVARRRGVRVRLLQLGDGAGPLYDRVAAACGPRTRLVALSHVAWGTGVRLDVEGAARAADERGALVLLDGAQGAGALATDPRALGAHAYALPAQKWLMGPEGLGALWVAEEAWERIDVAISGVDSGLVAGRRGELTPHPDARRYEAATLPELLVPGWTAALRWLEDLGWDRVHALIAAAAAACRETLAGLPGVRVLTPTDAGSGLIAFTVAGHPPEAACRLLAERGVIVRWLDHPPALRASCAAFTTQDDLDRLAEGVRALG